jgi:hypothetical protein
MHTYIHTYMHTYMHACIHTYIHTYIHAYIHAYIHIVSIHVAHRIDDRLVLYKFTHLIRFGLGLD